MRVRKQSRCSSFAGLTLGGSGAGNYTLNGASGTVTIVAPGGAKVPGVTNWIGIFNTAGDIAGWTPQGGSVSCSLSFLAGDAPPWGPSTGALVMQAPVPTAGMFCYFGKSVGNTNLSGYAQLEFDVKVGTNQNAWSIYTTLPAAVSFRRSKTPAACITAVRSRRFIPRPVTTAGSTWCFPRVFRNRQFGQCPTNGVRDGLRSFLSGGEYGFGICEYPMGQTAFDGESNGHRQSRQYGSYR